MPDRTIRVAELARVEGEGSLTIRFEGDRVESVELSIFEPPRFFEAFLRGRHQSEPPDVTARICGICPVAYQMSACHAIERAHGVRVDGPIRALRRLLYCGEWIESHVLHVFLLHAPDFLGYEDAVRMAADHGQRVKDGLAMKKAGNEIVTVLGGRPIHPVNVRLGGFYRAPAKRELRALLPSLERGRDLARETVRWTAGLPFPDLTRDVEFVALRHPDEYPMNEGRLVSSRGLDADVDAYDEHFVESHVARSTALHSAKSGGGLYLCGPTARYNLNADRLSPAARDAAREVGLEVPITNPFRSILARTVETVHAFDEAIAIVEAYEPPDRPAVEVPTGAATGRAVTEAPRGILYHRYRTNAEGLIEDAKIVPPTSQNQPAIEADLRALAPDLLALPLDAATRRAEQAIRNYDPCISCSTHFLRLVIERA